SSVYNLSRLNRRTISQLTLQKQDFTMNAQNALKLSIDMGDLITMSYLQDLTDAEMLHRPAETANHIKWQLGHLIASEHSMLEQDAPGSMPSHPEGFADRYTKETAVLNHDTAFDSKEVLLATYQAQRAGTLRTLSTMTDADFDKETGIDYAPT